MYKEGRLDLLFRLASWTKKLFLKSAILFQSMMRLLLIGVIEKVCSRCWIYTADHCATPQSYFSFLVLQKQRIHLGRKSIKYLTNTLKK